MKKILIPMLVASALCISLAGCGGNDETADITENTDPVSITSEKVDRTAWNAAFTAEPNYSVKSVVTMSETENGTTMSQVATYVYHFTADKISLTMRVAEGGKTAYEAEGYLEVDGKEVTFWQRYKEADEKDWSEWDRETYEKSDLPEIFSVAGGLTFAKDNFANFSYSDADKGYLATASGLTEMKTELSGAFGSLLGEDLSAPSKVILKINGGKPSACIVTAEQAAAKTRDGQPTEGTESGTPGQGGENESGTPGQGGENESGTPGQGGENESGTPGQGGENESGTPGQGGENESGTPGQGGENESGTPGQGGETQPTPSTRSAKISQVYYDYGTTTVTRPAGLTATEDETPRRVRVRF